MQLSLVFGLALPSLSSTLSGCPRIEASKCLKFTTPWPSRECATSKGFQRDEVPGLPETTRAPFNHLGGLDNLSSLEFPICRYVSADGECRHDLGGPH